LELGHFPYLATSSSYIFLNYCFGANII
jgi:hypothetical protein